MGVEGRAGKPSVFPIVVANHAAYLAGERLSRALTDPRTLAELLYNAYRFYGYDIIMVFADVLVEAEAMGCEIRMADDEPPVLERPAGERARVAERGSAGRMGVVLEATEILRRIVGQRVPVLTSLKGPFSLACFLCGVEEFLERTIVAPEQANWYLRLALMNQLFFVREIVRRGGVPFIGDPLASGSVIGPQVFRRFALPGLKALVEEVHRLGCWTGVHICGDTRRLLGMMRETGAEVLSIDEMDLGFVRGAVGTGVVIMGNVSTGLIETGTPAQVRAAALECLSKGMPRMILASACDVPTRAPSENVRALVEAGRGWRCG